MSARVLSVAMGLALWGAASDASAGTVTLNPPQWSQGNTQIGVPVDTPDGGVTYEVLQTPVTGPGTVTTSSAGNANLVGSYSASAQVRASTLPNPSLSATATDSGAASYANASLELDYTIEIVGPSGMVPLVAKASGDTNSTYASSSAVDLSLLLPGNDVVFEAASLFGQAEGGFQSSFQASNTYQTAANQPIGVMMLASAGADTNASGNAASASAFVDPYFYIDPSFVNASAYSIEISPGIGNMPSGVPEPSTWVMMLFGFAGLGLAGYRKAKNGHAALVATRSVQP